MRIGFTKLLIFFRPLLWPLAFLYGLVTFIRNWLYDHGFFRIYEPPVFSIGIGNLAVGGTGKTPMTAYLIELFHDQQVAVISRGYGRKSKGYREVKPGDSPDTVGDEIKMLFDRYQGTTRFFVAEDRVHGVRKILEQFPEVEVILFDDVFQHRAVKPYLQLVLSACQKTFDKDFLMPLGRLRESKKGIKRAQALIVTKCSDLADFENARGELVPWLSQEQVILGSFNALSDRVNINGESLKLKSNANVLAGLADNHSFLKSLSGAYNIKELHFYPDHFAYSIKEVKELLQKDDLPLITTEKDFVKIKALGLSDQQLARFFVISQSVCFYNPDQLLSFISNAFKRFQKEKGSVING